MCGCAWHYISAPCKLHDLWHSRCNNFISFTPNRNDTVRYALDVLAILTVVPKIQLQLAESVDVLDEAGSTVSTVGKKSNMM